jgi:hypothetical protein
MPVLFAPFAPCAYNVQGLIQQDHVALPASLQTVDSWWRLLHHCVDDGASARACASTHCAGIGPLVKQSCTHVSQPNFAPCLALRGKCVTWGFIIEYA